MTKYETKVDQGSPHGFFSYRMSGDPNWIVIPLAAHKCMTLKGLKGNLAPALDIDKTKLSFVSGRDGDDYTSGDVVEIVVLCD
jgi:hypothetical protein